MTKKGEQHIRKGNGGMKGGEEKMEEGEGISVE